MGSLALVFLNSLAEPEYGSKRSFVRQRRWFHLGNIGGIVSDYASAFGSGHGLSAQSPGFTSLYYCLVHVVKPTNILIIGTGEGTVPVIFA